MGAPTDAELITRVAARDLEAYSELHRRNARATFGLALRATGDRERAERATDDASAAVWRAASTFDGQRDDAEEWLFDLAAATVQLDRATTGDRESWRAHRALTLLPDSDREALELAFWSGMSTVEIAEFVNTTVDDVAAHAERALDLLAARLDVPALQARALLERSSRPAELPPEHASPPRPPRASAVPMPHRYRSTAVVGAVIVALLLFGLGWLLGGGGNSRQEVATIALTGSDGASGEVVVRRADDAGNWPVDLEVDGVPPPPRGSPYELRLRPAGGQERIVGTFATDGESVSVSFSVPIAPSAGDRWVVVLVTDGRAEPVLRGTSG